MREEATIEEWKELYGLAGRFMEKKPWVFLTNEEYIHIRFSEDEEAFFTIMGNGGMEYGFGMYIGEIAFRELQLHLRSFEEDFADEYGLFLQNCLVMFADRKEDVPEEQMAVIKKLKPAFFGKRGRAWVYFENHARGYLPYIPDGKDVRTLIRYLEQLLPCLDLIEKARPRGLHLIGSGYNYEQVQGKWTLSLVQWNRKEMSRLPITDQSGKLKEASAKWKRLRAVWEIDLFPMNSRIDDKKYDRPLFPCMLLAVDHKRGTVVYQSLLMPECGPCELCSALAEMMDAQGRPAEILVSGTVMKEILSPVFEKEAGIPVKTSSLRQLEAAKEGLLNHIAMSSSESVFQSLGLKPDEVESLMKLAGVSSEEELIMLFGERLKSIQDQGANLFFGAPDDEYDGEIVWQRDLNMRQKTASVRQFFEYSFPYEEETELDEAEEDDWDDEEKALGVIDASWCDDWSAMIGLCRKDSLRDTLKKLGGEPGSKKKEELTEEVHGMLSAKPGRLKEILSDEERTLIKKLRSMINKEECCSTENFPYPEELIVSLLEKGVIDITTGQSDYANYLTIMLPRRLKGVRL